MLADNFSSDDSLDNTVHSQLISPCLCRDSYLHQKCLEKKILEEDGGSFDLMYCTTCKENYASTKRLRSFKNMFAVAGYYAKNKGMSFCWDICTLYGILMVTVKSALSMTSNVVKTTDKRFWLTQVSILFSFLSGMAHASFRKKLKAKILQFLFRMQLILFHTEFHDHPRNGGDSPFTRVT